MSKLSAFHDVINSEGSILAYRQEDEHNYTMRASLREGGKVLFVVSHENFSDYINGEITLCDLVLRSSPQNIMIENKVERLVIPLVDFNLKSVRLGELCFTEINSDMRSGFDISGLET